MNDVARLIQTGAQGGTAADLLVALFLLALAPVLVVSVTSFPRIVVVLALLRASLGAQALPPNAVIAALALMLSTAVMTPTIARIDKESVRPFLSHRLSLGQAVVRGAEPVNDFMLRQTRRADVEAFARIARVRSDELKRPPFGVVAPAFLVGELRSAFAMGFALALPFVVIDLVVASVLMSLGMFMVSPATLALPIKLLLFVVADGWTLVAGALVASYR